MTTVNELHERTSISLSKENYEKLKSRGKFGDTFDTIIGRILKESTK